MPDVDAILDDFFMQALQGLMDLARTTDKPHIKLRALLEIARLCNPDKKPRRSPRAHGAPSASAGPQAPAFSRAPAPLHAPRPVARAPGSERIEAPAPRATDHGSARSVRPSTEPCPICQTSTPRPACAPCLPRMDDIERSERIRMATQAREAIAQNESRGLPVPKQWRAWATVDAGLRDTS